LSLGPKICAPLKPRLRRFAVLPDGCINDVRLVEEGNAFENVRSSFLEHEDIYVSRTPDGLSTREIGEWAEGVCEYGPWVACAQQHLTTAVRFLIVQRRLASLRAVAPEVDSASIEQQVEAIGTALGRIRAIKTKVTELGGCADVINEQASQLREGIKEALVCIEESIRSARKAKPVLGSVVSMDKTAAAH
jgi:hypothetical protein